MAGKVINGGSGPQRHEGSKQQKVIIAGRQEGSFSFVPPMVAKNHGDTESGRNTDQFYMIFV